MSQSSSDRIHVRHLKGTGMPASRLVNRNIVSARGRTSMRLEPELWDALAEICRRQGITIRQLVSEIEDGQDNARARTSAMRVYALSYFRAAATEDGHAAAGHGLLRE